MEQGIVTLELWDVVREELARSFPSDVFANWFEGLRAQCDGDDVLVLNAKNEFASIWIEDNYLDLIRDKVRAIAGSEVDVQLKVMPSLDEPSSGPREATTMSSDSSAVTRERMPATRRNGRHYATHDGKRPKQYINPRNTFDNFIVGGSNQLAHAASMAVAAEPGNAYNPLFLYGETGLGKTHLMHAVAHTIQENNPESNVVYVSCEKFTNKFLKAIRENSLDEFRRFYRKVDVLLIDDIQFLEGKERTQEEFFHTFNELFESQRQICFSSDRPASEISKLESRLVSRFQWGMVTDIQAPDLETRVAILKKKAMATGAQGLSEEIFSFLASRVTRNVRRMEGALIKVASYAKLVKKPLDLETAERLVKDILQEESQHQITVDRVQRKVVEYFDLKISDMTSKRRPAHIAFPRQIAMYLSRLLTNLPLKEIGQEFGGRDHGTVIHACKTVENIMEQDDSVKRNVEYLIKQLNG